jgi:hypothetical protein
MNADQEEEEDTGAPPAFLRWLPAGAGAAFVLLVGGWVYYEVPAMWRAGKPWRAVATGAFAALVLYAWLRFVLQIWRGRRAAAEESAAARRDRD